jgi:hypothetical protein
MFDVIPKTFHNIIHCSGVILGMTKPILTTSFQKSLITGAIPNDWKTAHVPNIN